MQRAVGRGLTKSVGREHEMEALRHAAEQAKEGRGQIVAAMAEPGVGKSRLFYEFKATSQSGWIARQQGRLAIIRPERHRKIADCPLERGGFEPPVSRETFAKKNLREYWRNFSSTSASILQRVSSPSVRYEFRG